VAPAPAPTVQRDPADALLTARALDGGEDEPPSPAEMALVERVRREYSRKRRIRRGLVAAGVVLVALVAALVLLQRGPRPPVAANLRPADVAAPPAPRTVAPSAPAEEPPGPTAAPAERPATPEAATIPPPRTAAPPVRETPADPPQHSTEPPVPVDLPPRASTPPAKGAEPSQPIARSRAPVRQVPNPGFEPAATPRTEAPRPDVRVQVAQKATEGAVDYTVRVSRADGSPVGDADVRLRGVTTDGVIVEARLEPAGEPGVYRSLLAFSPRGPRDLTVRVARADGIVEVPVGEPWGSSQR
jgi:hypothetical protein